MKKTIQLLLLATISATVFAQGIPASRIIEKKNVVLEEFTGIHCVWCPDGHKRALNLYRANPDDVVLINIHEGGYAVAAAGEVDLEIQQGVTISNSSGLTGYPAGMVNRHVFTGTSAAMSRTEWSAAASQILAEDAIANLGVEAFIDVQTRLLTVNVEVYYTGNSSQNSNRLTVAILQDNIIGTQDIASQVTPDPSLVVGDGLYKHNHVLRHIIIPPGSPNNYAYGDIIGPAVAGSVINKTYTYVLPDTIGNVRVWLGDLKIAAFVSETTKEIVTGHVVQPSYVNFLNVDAVAISGSIEYDAVCGFTTKPTITVQNNGSQPLTSLFIDYSVNGSPVKTYNWTGNLASLQFEEVELNDINYFPQATNTIEFTTRAPNNSTDGNITNDSIIKTFPSAPDVSETIIMTLKMDNYGSEVSWEVVNSAGTVLYASAPYQDITNPPAFIDTFQLTPGDCYQFIIYDEFGDGILGSTKGVTLQDDQGTVIVSNYREYGKEGIVNFGIDAPQPDSSDVFQPVGIFDIDDVKISVFPNPANQSVIVRCPSSYAAKNIISFTDILGKEIFSSSGKSDVRFNTSSLESGLYLINVDGCGKRSSQKLMVIH